MHTSERPVWQQLSEHAARIVRVRLPDLAQVPGRFDRLCFRAAGITLDLSKQRIDDAVMAALIALGEEAALPSALTALMSGAKVNATEGRAALHTALRAPANERPPGIAATVEAELERMLSLAEDIRSGRWRGATGRAVTDVVHIGIGGSHLGPALAIDALPHGRPRPPKCHFLANIDGRLAQEVLRGLTPETTVVVIASKSFTTLESRVNATSVRSWFKERGAADSISRHFHAVTARPDAALAFGVPADNVLAMWDWVGGRYSLWSSVGLPIAIHLGERGFRQLLAGAHAMDRHALTAPLGRNLPVLLALVGIWNYNFLGAQSHAVLPYAHGLRLLPDYLQQLEMESNGKSVRQDGSMLDLQTMPVLWGGEEPNGQHAFHQFLHQGTRMFSADFIVALERSAEYPDHHDWLVANCLAQSEALLQGRRLDESSGDALAQHRAMPGNRPSSTILLDALDPASLGALIALYEHKVFCQGMIWELNPFDQWGVELGKTLGESVHRALGGGEAGAVSPVTRRLIEVVKRQQMD